MIENSNDNVSLNIVFVVKALGNPGGGAERILVDVSSGLANRGHTISIISSDPEGRASHYSLDPDVQRVNLGIGCITDKSSASVVLRRMIGIRRTVTRIDPDIVVAFMHSSYLPTGIALMGTGIPMIASEHIGPEHYKSRLLEKLILQLSPLVSERITVVSEQILHSFGWWLRRRMTVIPNPISIPANKSRAHTGTNPSRTRTLLSVGRLAPQKNQRCLIAAFARVSSQFQNWKLRIVGEGELREELESQIMQLQLMDRIELPGASSDVSKEYANADLFVLPSTYESFGLATAEALLHGLPAIGFSDCPGTNCLIRNGENGVLVKGLDKTEALARAFEELMSDPEELKRLSNASTEYLERQYDIDSVIDAWEDLLRKSVC
jgi:glycosyltransferase involved in cell wall biosynthesis